MTADVVELPTERPNTDRLDPERVAAVADIWMARYRRQLRLTRHDPKDAA